MHVLLAHATVVRTVKLHTAHAVEVAHGVGNDSLHRVFSVRLCIDVARNFST